MNSNDRDRRHKNRSVFSIEEDDKLRRLVKEYGTQEWDLISEIMKTRNPRQCRERWKHYLSAPNTNKPWTQKDDELLMANYKKYGKKWTKLAKCFRGRSDLSVKNRVEQLLKNQEPENICEISQNDILIINTNESKITDKYEEPPGSAQAQMSMQFILN